MRAVVRFDQHPLSERQQLNATFDQLKPDSRRLLVSLAERILTGQAALAAIRSRSIGKPVITIDGDDRPVA